MAYRGSSAGVQAGFSHGIGFVAKLFPPFPFPFLDFHSFHFSSTFQFASSALLLFCNVSSSVLGRGDVERRCAGSLGAQVRVALRG